MASPDRDVVGIEDDEAEVEMPRRSEVSILEPSLNEFVRDGLRQCHLRFTTEHPEAG